MKIQLERTIDVQTAGQNLTNFLAEQSGLSKLKLKSAMTKGAVWLKRANKPRKRLRRAKETLQVRDKIELIYDEDLLTRITPDPNCLQDKHVYKNYFKTSIKEDHGNK